MSSMKYVAVVCFLVLASCGVSNASVNVSINVTVYLPPPSKWVSFDCSVAGTFQVPPGKSHQWIVPSDTQADKCAVTWGHSQATFSAYDANVDAGHYIIFWGIKLDGFYYSWDNLNWVKGASWEH